MKRNWIVKGVIIIFASSMFYACKKEIEGNSDSPFSEIWALVSNDAPLMEMTYETEFITYQEVIANRAKAEHQFFDLVAGQPNIKRKGIVLKLYGDGNMNTEMTDLTPKTQLPTIAHNSKPDSRPKIKKTIIEGNRMRTYDAEGNLLHENQLDKATTSPFLVEQIQMLKNQMGINEIAQTISTMQLSRIFGNNMADIERQAQESGGTITIQDKLKIIKMPMPNPQSDKQKNIILTIDKFKNLPIHYDITDASNKIIFTTYYRYDNLQNEFPSLQQVNTSTFDVSATGSDVVIHNNMTISNVNTIIR